MFILRDIIEHLGVLTWLLLQRFFGNCIAIFSDFSCLLPNVNEFSCIGRWLKAGAEVRLIPVKICLVEHEFVCETLHQYMYIIIATDWITAILLRKLDYIYNYIIIYIYMSHNTSHIYPTYATSISNSLNCYCPGMLGWPTHTKMG